MSVATNYFDRKTSTRTAAGLQSPHTPQRNVISSTLTSPGPGYRADDDVVIFQIGARNMYAGFAGDHSPRCKYSFKPEDSERVGDYRRWLPGFQTGFRSDVDMSRWGTDHELWQKDVRYMDMGLVEDKLERGIRETYTKHLLLDSKSRKVLLVLPSLLPHAILGTVLSTFFHSFQIPSISVMSIPLLSVLAAGQRSGLVVDIGWHESIVTSVYELREVKQFRSTRAMKTVTLEMARLLTALMKDQSSRRDPNRANNFEPNQEELGVDLVYAEDVLMRLAWCDCRAHSDSANLVQMPEVMSNTTSQHNETVLNRSVPGQSTPSDHSISLAIPSFGDLRVPFQLFSDSVLEGLLDGKDQLNQDEDELSVHFLIYTLLRKLSPDVRIECLENVMFIGGGSNVLGLQARVLYELGHLVDTLGWSPVRGQAVKKQEARSKNGLSDKYQPDEPSTGHAVSSDDHSFSQGSMSATLHARPYLAAGRRSESGEKERRVKTALSQKIRSIQTLGPWSGASLAGALRLRGIVEVDRDSFLQTGLSGAKNIKDINIDTSRNQQNLSQSISRNTGIDGIQWTLGTWA